MNMIEKRPLLGWGYDHFGKEYNHTQAEYFEANRGLEIEKENAAFVRTPYNEILYHLVEGGMFTASAKAKTQVVGQMNFNMIIPAPNCPTCTGISSKSIENHCFFYPK
jgi:hypothetical protein